MERRRIGGRSGVGLRVAVVGLTLFLFSLVGARAQGWLEGGPPIAVANELTVSGFSMGAFFASQFQVAYSSLVTGVGLFSGGPYYCAEGSQAQAMGMCRPGPPPPVIYLMDDAKKFAEDGLIDSPKNLSSTQVFIFTGTNDTVLDTSVSQAADAFYRGFNATNVTTILDMPVPHCIPVANVTYPCNETSNSAPYLCNCDDYDAVGQMLQQVLGGATLAPPVPQNSSSLYKFNQTVFEPASSGGSSTLAKFGWAYIPNICLSNTTICKLHVFFHGEMLNPMQFSNLLQYSSLNNWAEGNNITVVYPQAQTVFDWWGFTNSDYSLKLGLHIQAVSNLLSNITTIAIPPL